MKTIFLILFCLLSVNVFADVPNTFKSGDILTADKLNENFSSIKGMLKMYQNDGSLLGYLPNGTADPYYSYKLFTEKHYLFSVSLDNASGSYYLGYEEYLAFESDDCTGQAYGNGDNRSLFKLNGRVHSVGNLAYYRPTNEPWVYINAISTKSGESACRYEPHSSYQRKIYLNDPLITGFSGISAPVTIGF